MRQGILYDMLGPLPSHDMRDVTVAQFMQRYHVDAQQRGASGAYAAALHEKKWRAMPSTRCVAVARWAAKLHEIGIPVAYSATTGIRPISSACRHAGSSREEQEHLAALC